MRSLPRLLRAHGVSRDVQFRPRRSSDRRWRDMSFGGRPLGGKPGPWSRGLYQTWVDDDAETPPLPVSPTSHLLVLFSLKRPRGTIRRERIKKS
ncbi:hypothetical protein LX32DRAFT_136175 [Colletotrichum zoysiae]|uniref:Uncharacterized protein n=1 Tax=Colletotrichum zoysiae TaxID=1216348 RepID=A0AAD9LZ17_9PEZI|nr:hypothetical protein LX32DRAFT_136175 [Colletotrichum zoysiae]